MFVYFGYNVPETFLVRERFIDPSKFRDIKNAFDSNTRHDFRAWTTNKDNDVASEFIHGFLKGTNPPVIVKCFNKPPYNSEQETENIGTDNMNKVSKIFPSIDKILKEAEKHEPKTFFHLFETNTNALKKMEHLLQRKVIDVINANNPDEEKITFKQVVEGTITIEELTAKFMATPANPGWADSIPIYMYFYGESRKGNYETPPNRDELSQALTTALGVIEGLISQRGGGKRSSGRTPRKAGPAPKRKSPASKKYVKTSRKDPSGRVVYTRAGSNGEYVRRKDKTGTFSFRRV